MRFSESNPQFEASPPLDERNSGERLRAFRIMIDGALQDPKSADIEAITVEGKVLVDFYADTAEDDFLVEEIEVLVNAARDAVKAVKTVKVAALV